MLGHHGLIELWHSLLEFHTVHWFVFRCSRHWKFFFTSCGCVPAREGIKTWPRLPMFQERSIRTYSVTVWENCVYPFDGSKELIPANQRMLSLNVGVDEVQTDEHGEILESLGKKEIRQPLKILGLQWMHRWTMLHWTTALPRMETKIWVQA